MKFCKLTFVFLMTSIICQGQNTAVLTGKITDPNSRTVFLQGNVTGDNGRPKMVIYDSTAVDESNEFRMMVKIDSTSQMAFFDGKEQAKLILSPGDSLYMTLNTLAFDETIRFYGKGSEKNNAIAAILLFDEINMVEVYQGLEAEILDSSKIYKDYDKAVEAYVKLVESYQKEIPEFSDFGDQLIATKNLMGKRLRPLVREKIVFKEKKDALLGKEAIDFTGIDLDGDSISLSDFKGKLTVVDFWATWCGPCKAEFPSYKMLEEKYGEQVNFVSVGVYCPEEDWRDMAAKEGFSHNIYLSREADAQISDYEVQYIPRYLVLNENFEVIDFNAPKPSSGELEKHWVK